MRHQKRLKKLGLAKDHRDSLLKNLVADLVLHGKIRTTKSRAKALSARFARMMKLVRKTDKREAIRVLPNYCANSKNDAARKKVINELKVKYEQKTSGFTRIIPISIRKGDCAALVQIELI